MGFGQILIGFGQGKVLLVADRVIRDQSLFVGGRVFEGDDRGRFVGAILDEVLVLVDPGVGNLVRGVIDDRVMLEVLDRELLGLEAERAVLEPPKLEGEELVDPAGEDDGLGQGIPVGAVLEVIAGELDLDPLKKILDQNAVAAIGDSLIEVVEVVVVVGEAERQPLDDRGGQFLAITAPLFFRVFLDQLGVDRPPDEGKGLLLEVLWLADVLFGDFLGDFRLRFFGRGDAPKLVEGVHVEGQVVELAMVVGQGGVDERQHRAITLDEGPDVLV